MGYNKKSSKELKKYLKRNEGWIQSEKVLFFQMPSDLDIFLVPRHQSIGNNNCCRKQLEHSIHMTCDAQTNVLEGSKPSQSFFLGLEIGCKYPSIAPMHPQNSCCSLFSRNPFNTVCFSLFVVGNFIDNAVHEFTTSRNVLVMA